MGMSEKQKRATEKVIHWAFLRGMMMVTWRETRRAQTTRLGNWKVQMMVLAKAMQIRTAAERETQTQMA